MEIFKNTVFIVIAFVSLLFLSSCGSGRGSDSSAGLNHANETGGIVVQLGWKKNKPELSKISDDCASHDVARVVITVSDASSVRIKSGEFTCQDGQGEVTGIPVQDNLKVKVELKDSDGNVRSVTEKDGVSIENGVSTVVQVTLTEPDGRWGSMKWGKNKWGL